MAVSIALLFWFMWRWTIWMDSLSKVMYALLSTMMESTLSYSERRTPSSRARGVARLCS